MPFLLPGIADPNRPAPMEVVAERFAVDARRMRAWVDDGLPLVDGLIDPFAATNWVTWHRLADCPVLARAWRGYLVVFAGFLGGEVAPRRVRWHRTHRLHLPVQARRIDRFLPRPLATPWQRVLADDGLGGRGLPAGAHWLVRSDRGEETLNGCVDLELRPRRTLSQGSPEHTVLLAEVEGLVADFRYEYRHHTGGEMARASDSRRSGSCLDCARELARRFAARGRPARLVAGVIAHDAFANPHFWLEVETTVGPVPVDPSLPAIARMLGADWREVASLYTGGCDNRRVALASQPVAHVPGGPTIGSLIGEAVIEDLGGDRWNAWSCLDWVCGDCEQAFA
ncbi:MAG: hypothetical protein H0W72_00130 [Planctomycetes bacterium]|nr:hypothetical protein [Planctomycetota bacterium]